MIGRNDTGASGEGVWSRSVACRRIAALLEGFSGRSSCIAEPASCLRSRAFAAVASSAACRPIARNLDGTSLLRLSASAGAAGSFGETRWSAGRVGLCPSIAAADVRRTRVCSEWVSIRADDGSASETDAIDCSPFGSAFSVDPGAIVPPTPVRRATARAASGTMASLASVIAEPSLGRICNRKSAIGHDDPGHVVGHRLVRCFGDRRGCRRGEQARRRAQPARGCRW